MMRTLHSLLAAAAVAVAGYTATVQAQEKPEDKPPADIWEAAAKGDVAAIKGFLAKDNKIDDQNKNGYSILHIAVRSGQAAVAEFALANGADINLRSNSKKTPLHYTAQYNQLALAKLLVQGPDACAVLNRISSADVDVEPGTSVYTTWLNDRGGIEADLTVNRLDEETLDNELALDARAAHSIAIAQPIVTVDQLSRLYYVGHSALRILKNAGVDIKG